MPRCMARLRGVFGFKCKGLVDVGKEKPDGEHSTALVQSTAKVNSKSLQAARSEEKLIISAASKHGVVSGFPACTSRAPAPHYCI